MASSVLYVDDDRGLCQIVAKALGGEGYAVRVAHDGEEAAAAIAEDPPDLLLLDLFLPRRDGFEVLRELRAEAGPLGQLPVVLLSSCSPTQAYRDRAHELRATALLTKPVPLDRLIEIVVSQLGEAKPAPRSASRQRGRRSRRVRSMSGSLARIPFPAVLHHLHGMRATGVLHLAVGRKRKWIQMRDGYPVGVRSNLVRETLGSYLERTGRITRATLEESREPLRRGMRQGEILVAMDVMSEEQVAEVLREQADEKLFEIFTWEKGNFRFERGAKLQRANAVGLGRSPANLILEGVRSRFPLERVDRYIRQQGHRHVRRSEAPFYRFQEIHIAPAEEALLRGLDGTQPLSDFERENEGLRRTVYGLLAAGFLELSGKPRSKTVRGDGPKTARGDGPKTARGGGRRPGPVEKRPAETPAPERDPRQDDPRQLELMALAEQLRAGSHFEMLGLDEGASERELREAYGRLSAHSHPDRYSGCSQAVRDLAAEVHELVEKAYSTLADPRARQEYVLAQRKARRADETRRQGELALEAETEFRRGEAAMRIRDYEAALAHFGRALQLYPDEGDHHAHYGWALYLCHPGEPQIVAEALEHVKRGVKLASHREKPYLFMGRLYKVIGRADVSEKMFTRAIQIQPECVEALRELRLINMRRERSKGFIGRLFRRQ